MKKALCTAVCMLLMSLSVIAEGLLPYYAVTNRSNVNMKSKPDSKSRLVMQIKTKGTKLTVLSGQPDGQGNEWLEVETQRGRKVHPIEVYNEDGRKAHRQDEREIRFMVRCLL